MNFQRSASLFLLSSLSSIKRKDELKPKVHLYVMANPSLSSENGLCGYTSSHIYCMCMSLWSKGRPTTSLWSSCLISCRNVFGLCLCTCSSEIGLSFCLFTSSWSALRQERGSRGEAYRGLQMPVFKGVSTPYFCIIHITPHRWAISRWQQKTLAISWRDTAAADTQTPFPLLLLPDEKMGLSLWGRRVCVAAFETTYYGLKKNCLKAQKTKCLRERKRMERWT